MALFQSLGLKHMCRVPSGLWGYVREDTHSVGQEIGIGHSLPDHFIKSPLYVLPVLSGNLLLGVLDRGNIRVSTDSIGPRHIVYGIQGVQEGLLQGNYVLDHGGRSRGSHLSRLHLEGWLGHYVMSMGNVVFKGW